MNDERSATDGTERPAPAIGLGERFAPGEHGRVERVLDDLEALGVEHLRVPIPSTGARAGADEAWYAWLLPRLAEDVTVLPCFTRPAPPHAGRSERAREAVDYAAFVGRTLDRFGDCFSWVELAIASSSRDGAGRLDRGGEGVAALAEAVEAVRVRGKRVVLGGVRPPDVQRLERMGREGLLDAADAVGVRVMPGRESGARVAREEDLRAVRDVLARRGADAAVWITEAGYATRQYDEYRQLQAFAEAAAAPAERLYWSAVHDRARADASWEGERRAHLGLRRSNGRPKLLLRVWAEQGLDGVRRLARLGERDGNERRRIGTAPALAPKNGRRPVLITGGAGFIGANLAHRLLEGGEPVLIFDNLSRPGVERNLQWLIDEHGPLLSWRIDDVRNAQALREAVRHAAHVFHFAGQVAVTTSLERPEEDFAVNACGTLNLLEALRALPNPPPLVFTSTNKVYGRLESLALREEATRYVPADERVRARGISEARPISFHSPYGCSKGAAEQYVLDYARTYGLPALVFRMSCIYGTRQFGTEDQGWVAHFVRRTLREAPITLYGDGKQVRDILFVEDLVRALQAARAQAEDLAGEAFNIGGGPPRSVSLLELIDLTAELHGRRPPIRFADWRRGDQKYFVADTGKFAEATGWAPRVGVREGVERLYRWLERAPAQTSGQYPLPVTGEAS